MNTKNSINVEGRPENAEVTPLITAVYTQIC